MTHSINQLRLALIAGLVLFVVAVLSVTGYTLWLLQRDVIADGYEISEMHARNLEEFVTQNLRFAETAGQQALRTRNGALAVKETEASLLDALRESPFLRSMSVLDKGNRIIASSNAANRGLVVDPQNFWPPTSQTAEVLTIGAPWAGRDFATGHPVKQQQASTAIEQYFVPIAKDTTVGGSSVRLLIALNPDFFISHVAQALPGSEGAAVVVRYDGMVLMDSGAARVGVMRDFVAEGVHLDDVESGQLELEDGVRGTQLVAYKASQLYPLAVFVQRPRALALGYWQARATALVAIVVPALVMVIFVSLFFLRRQKQYNFQREEMERLQRINATVFEASAEAIIITDARANIISVNPAFSRITGWGAHEVIGRNPRLLGSGQQDSAFYAELWRVLLQKGDWHGEVVNRKKDGTLYNARLSIIATRDERGQLQHFIGDIWDITANKAAEAALAESRNLLVSVVNTVPMRVFWKDRDLRYLGCNMAFAADAGMPHPDNVIGRDDYQMGWAAQAELYRADDRAVMDSGVPKLFFDEPQTTPDGRTIWLRTSKVPLRDDGKAIVGVLGIYEDISEYKRIQTALAVSEERFRRAFYLTPDSLNINRLDDGLYVSVNRGFTQLTGYTESEVVGHTSADINIWNDLKDRARLVDGLRNHGTVTNLEAVFRAKDGHTLHGLMSASVIDLDGVPHILSVTRNISELKAGEDKLRLLASVFANSREGIMITSTDGTIIDVNDAFTRITGYTHDEVLGRNPRLLNSGRQGREHYVKMWRDLIEKGHWYGEIWNRRKSGETYAEMQTISVVRDADGVPQHYVSLFSDISAYKAHQNQLEHIAHYDALTGLPNRVLLADRMHQGIAQVLRRKELLAVAFLDLDGFKSVNDAFGHEAGDQLLIAVSERMKQTLRDGDTLARLGGDEFVAVLLDLPDVESCVHMLTRLLSAVSEPVVFGDQVLRVSGSVGVTFFPQTDEVDADQLLRQADLAMYQAKLAGKNRYHVFDAELDRNMRGQHEELESIRLALHAQEFELHYQPKVNMRSGKVVGVEALIRWRHPTQGLLTPGAFLPVIEDHPLAVELGEWVIDTALAQVETWKRAGLHLPVSVNIGARQLQQSDFIARLRTFLDRHPALERGDLELEVLETSALEDLHHVSKVMEDCRELGVSFALDDFGTGYSSLTYLKRLPVAQLKIDQSFVRDMLIDPDDLAILEGTIGLTNAFRLAVIAEGVEAVEHGTMLLRMGCELAQGYVIAKPMRPEELPLWIANWRTYPEWLDQRVVERKDFPLLFSGVEHRAWVLALESFLRGERDAPPPLDATKCRVGLWLHDGGLDSYANPGAHAAVHALHDEVHTVAARILQSHAQGLKAAVADGLLELHRLRDGLLTALDKLLR
ncbi:MAG: EAL domain-containing protein [Burkholderiales bacterium]|nr:EAL domain-containing protein [Burkholderiales bacterium]